MTSSESFDSVTAYGSTPAERLSLVRTIVAIANTAGGVIRVTPVTAAARRDLDGPAIERAVARHAGPPLHGIASTEGPGGAVAIDVPDSEHKPHVFTTTGACENGTGETISVFHPGQIWVRHDGRDRAATPDDLRRLTYDAAGRLLERVGEQIRRPGFTALPEDQEQPIRVRLTDDEEALLVRADLDYTYPHTRQSLAREAGRKYSFIAAAVRALDLEASAELAYADRNSAGHPTRWRYTDEARDKLVAHLAAHPDWDPRHPDA